MKTAEERARELMERYWAKGTFTRLTGVETLARAFKEYARDQRHACAQRVDSVLEEREYHPSARKEARDVVSSTPFPGEGR